MGIKEQIIENIGNAYINLHLEMSERIFDSLEDKNGGKPDPYSTKPMWVSTDAYRGRVKLGGEKSKTGKTKKFAGGYAQLKSESGKPPLQLTSDLKSSFSNGLRKINDFEYHVVMPKHDIDKVNGHFKRFFYPSMEELETTKRIILKGE